MRRDWGIDWDIDWDIDRDIGKRNRLTKSPILTRPRERMVTKAR